jgi:phage terminase large subunit
MSKVALNRCFQAANTCTDRWRILYGSAGSGKSVNVAMDYILKLSDVRYKGANLLCVRRSEASHAQSTYAELKKAIFNIFGDTWGEYWAVKQIPLLLRCKLTGAEIAFRGVNDLSQVEKLKSITFSRGNLTWVWVEEATELRQADIYIINDRLRGALKNDKLYYQITLTFNPVSSEHWIKKLFFDKMKKDVYRHKSTYLDNKFVGEEFHKSMEIRREVDPEGYRVYGLGDWGETEGIIFNNWELAEVENDSKWYDDIAYGQDFGFNHYNALLRLGIKDGNIYVIDEIYVAEKDTDEIIELAEKWDKTYQMYCDSANPDKIQMWRRAGYVAIPADKSAKAGQRAILAQIDWLRQRKIYISPKCTGLLGEISAWRWAKDRVSGAYLDNPVNFNDDAIAALRYGIQSWFRRGDVETKDEKKELTPIGKHEEKLLKRIKRRLHGR